MLSTFKKTLTLLCTFFKQILYVHRGFLRASVNKSRFELKETRSSHVFGYVLFVFK